MAESVYMVRARTLLTGVADKSRDIREMVHEVLCNATMHAVAHGDVTLFDDALDALGKGADRQLVNNWAEHFGCARWNKNTESFSLHKGRKAALIKAGVELADLLECPAWYEPGKEKSQLNPAYDLMSRLRAVVKGYDNARGDGREIKNAWAAGKVATLLGQLEAELLATEHAEPIPTPVAAA